MTWSAFLWRLLILCVWMWIKSWSGTRNCRSWTTGLMHCRLERLSLRAVLPSWRTSTGGRTVRWERLTADSAIWNGFKTGNTFIKMNGLYLITWIGWNQVIKWCTPIPVNLHMYTLMNNHEREHIRERV